MTAFALPGPQEHAAWLRNRRRQLQKLLGAPEEELAPIHGAVLSRQVEKTRIVEKVNYEGEAGEKIPAYFLQPQNRALPLPAIIYLHSQSPDRSIGGRAALGEYKRLDGGIGAELVRRGYIVLAPEVTGHGERGDLEEGVESGRLLLQGWSLAAKTLWEIGRAIDYLQTRKEVEAGRIGLLGLGKGGLLGWLAAALEPRLSPVAIAWGASTYAELLNEKINLGHLAWLPGLLNWGDAPEVCRLIAPRPLFFCAGEKDPVFPYAGYQEIYWRVSQLYMRLGLEDKLEQYVTPGPPQPDKEFLARIGNWFDRWL
jgi:dienelactone hydrolase